VLVNVIHKYRKKPLASHGGVVWYGETFEVCTMFAIGKDIG
jgi:hypothetical protein